ncbi:DUF3304 domain-containing protein [Xanthomonas cerealis pv. cerealis]|uniref:DUF3304 domain-containing protein n=1 Tax=Xanthomonas translucens group TaxID=3390202 RepID=UPI000D340E16|nr:DUF3304 domain-containing protein [Xanthomonas translucens]QSQ53714.1 DUF3304 domain-containing protein [Xanthomonas translucens pv. undulosa]QSQ60665.1 DUF3304 domain-containing protein [Xanthomonas translucens pv. undulosa]UKE70988.1 DUF3304 domain-containing protein [Xanthomonas translucens pv. pistacia]
MSSNPRFFRKIINHSFSSIKEKSIKISIILLSLTAGGCMAREMTVNVVVFNYTSKPLAEMTVQGKYVGGYFQEYGDGGTGGGVFCCIDVKQGPAEVKWTYGGEEGTPKTGINASSSGDIPVLRGDYKYLGVHIYPDEKVEFTLTESIPAERREGEN